MIRAFIIAVVSDSRLQTPDPRLVACVLLSFCLVGCTGPEEEPIWEKVQIGDLAPYHNGKPPRPRLLDTINLDVHIFEVPAENIRELDDIRMMLHTRPLRFNDYDAFSANSFSVRFGQMQMWSDVRDLLLVAGGQRIARVSLLLSDGRAETMAVTALDSPRTVFFTSRRGSREAANVGPGILGLRIKSEKIAGSRGVCNVIAYPVFSLPTVGSSIQQLAARAKLREFLFTSAAFGLKMSPGDFVFLGPGRYISDQTALGGLFFSKPKGSLFLSETERRPPERKPAVRVFLLVCTAINY